MIWLRSLLNPYVILGVAIACLFGLWKWEKRKTTALKTEAAALQKSISMAEVELQNAEAINKSALDAVAQQAREVERQKLIAAAEAKKSRERLNAFNALNREVQNVKENPPVPDAIERILEFERLRSAPAGAEASGADESPEDGAANFDRHELSETTPAATTPN